MNIIFASTMPNQDFWVKLLKHSLPESELHIWGDDNESVGAEIAITWNPPKNLLLKEPNIRAIFNLGAGVDALLKLPNLHSDILVIRLEDAGMAVQMAEYALYAVLGISRNFTHYQELQHQIKWEPQPSIKREHWTIGILGLGEMGTRVAQSLTALDYSVAGWSRRARNIEGVKSFFGQNQLDTFLKGTRILINTLPLTAETKGILNKNTLGKLLSGCYLINVGRGDHLVEQDLLHLLNSGHILGASLDVFSHEPLPYQHPFWRDERINITPHIAAASLPEETVKQMAEKIRCYLQGGESLTGVVKIDVGY